MNTVKALSKQKPRPLDSALVASAKRIRETNRYTWKRNSATQQEQWQDEAWDLYDLVGELRFLVTTIAGRLGQAHLYVGKQDPKGEQAPERLGSTDPINELMHAFGGSNSGRAQLLTRLAVNLMVPGEGWLVGVPEADENGERDLSAMGEPESLTWHMLSVSEVSSTASDMVLLRLDDDEEEEFDPNEIYLIRVWDPHPRRAWKADSAARAALPILKELVGLTMHVSAQVDSRLAGAGLLVVPQSAQRALSVQAGVEEGEDVDVFTEGLMQAMMTPIGDRSSAAAVVPLVVTVPDEVADKFSHISFASPLDAEARNLREEAIRRLAMSMDSPPELLLGTAGMNHWGGWLVKEETVSSHIEPPLALICDALTTQYLWPALELRGVEDFEDYVIWYDVDHLITRPNIGADALQLHDRNALSDEALRRSNGFDENDAPESMSTDPAVSMVLDMVQKNPTLLSEPGTGVLLEHVRSLLKGEGAEPADEVDAEAPVEDPAPPSSAPATGEGVPESDGGEAP